jgi:ribosomal protein L37AE/L43A
MDIQPICPICHINSTTVTRQVTSGMWQDICDSCSTTFISQGEVVNDVVTVSDVIADEASQAAINPVLL